MPPKGRIQTVRLEAAWQGIDVDTAPSSVAKNKGLLLRNYLTGEKGQIRQRGPIVPATVSIGRTGKRPSGFVSGSDKLLFGYKDNAQATRVVEPWRAVHKNADDSELATASIAHSSGFSMSVLNLIDGDLDDAIPENVEASGTGGRPYVPGPRFVRFGRFVYYIGFDSWNDTINQGIKLNAQGGYERMTQLVKWDPTSAAVPQFDMPVNPFLLGQMDPNLDGNTADKVYGKHPHGSQDLLLHQGRLLMAGGAMLSSPNTLNASFNVTAFNYYDLLATAEIFSRTIWYSIPLSSTVFASGLEPSADYFYDITDYQAPLLNRINLPGDPSDPIIALVPVGRHVGVLCRNSITLLTGPTGSVAATMWSAKPVTQSLGCLDARSAVPSDEGVYFLSQQGFMYFDGVQIRDCSKGLHRTLIPAALEAVGDEGIDGGFAYAVRLPNDYIKLTIGYTPYGTTPATPTVTFCGLYHPPSDSWSEFSSAVFAGVLPDGAHAPIYLGRTANRAYAACHQNVALAITYLGSPENVPEADRGQENGENITTRWHSRVVDLASPFSRARLRRILIDYEWIVDGSVIDGEFSGPTVRIMNGDGVQLTSYSLPSGLDADVEITRMRHVQDFFSDTQDIQVRIDYASTARSLVKSTILDVWVEFEVTEPTTGPSVAVP